MKDASKGGKIGWIDLAQRDAPRLDVTSKNPGYKRIEENKRTIHRVEKITYQEEWGTLFQMQKISEGGRKGRPWQTE